MCGICGYTDREGFDVLKKMLTCMGHRGPNDSGYFVDDNISIGMVRLSIIDLLGGHQPISNEDNSVHVVFNGEIFNYIELREELETKGHIFRTSSDTETIVHAYDEYGLSFMHRLNGMFAIAIFDKQNGRLVLIRDRYGVKPLFYAVKDNSLVFGSEIKTVLCHPSVNRELDYEALSHYFSLRNIPAPFTVYKDIRSLLPGHMIVWDKNRCKVVQWYQLSMTPRWVENDEQLLVDHIDKILRDSIRLRLRSDVNYGAYLSGGIDSSTVVGIMSEYSPKPVKTFSLAFADSPAHKLDAYYARIIAEKYGTEHYEYIMSYDDLQQELPAVIAHLDQPFAGVISSFWLSRFMQQYVTVALSGDGADDLFASYGHHRLVWPVSAVQEALRNGTSLDTVDYGFFNDRREFVINLAQYEPWEWRLAYAAFMEHEKISLFSEAGKKLFMPFSTANFLKDIYLSCTAEADELNKILYLDINTLLHNEILYFNDMLSMANSMEVRTPFLDFRVAELACSIPGTLKIKDNTLKYILRKVAARYVPREILERPKEGFVLPKNTWLREGMAEMVKDVLSVSRLGIHGFFNQGYVDALVSKFFEGDEALTFKVWTLIILQIWYEQYLNMS